MPVFLLNLSEKDFVLLDFSLLMFDKYKLQNNDTKELPCTRLKMYKDIHHY